MGAGWHFLHLHAHLCFQVIDAILAFPRRKALIALLIWPLELEIRRGTRPPQHSNPVAEDISLIERPVAISLLKLVRAEILSGCLAPTHEEEMISPQRSGVGCSQGAVYDHRPGNTPVINGLSEGDAMLMAID